MDSYKLAVKFFTENSSNIQVEDFVPAFHRWIQSRALEGHQLIDVADYKHVHEGPGAVLVSHEANIHADLEDGRLGLLYIRKQPLPGSFHDRLRAVFQAALRCAAMLEPDESLKGRICFRTDEAVFKINDRLHAPNTPETFEQIRPDLDAFLRNLYGGPVELSHHPHPEKLFEVTIKASHSPSIDQLLSRVATT